MFWLKHDVFLDAKCVWRKYLLLSSSEYVLIVPRESVKIAAPIHPTSSRKLRPGNRWDFQDQAEGWNWHLCFQQELWLCSICTRRKNNRNIRQNEETSAIEKVRKLISIYFSITQQQKYNFFSGSSCYYQLKSSFPP